jgi:hypothetical protein
MDERKRPNLTLGHLAEITDGQNDCDHGAWEVLRPLLKPKGWSDKTRFTGPRPPKLTARFYLILSNYSNELFYMEVSKYPRYPPNRYFPDWLRNLARRVEDHVIAVVKDIEASDPEKSFSYHEVAEGEMRKNIRQRLHADMESRYNVQYLASPLEILAQLEPVLRALPSPSLSPHIQEPPAGPPSKQEISQHQPEAKKTKGTLYSPAAVAKLEAYVKKRGMSYTEFATEARTSDKTLRGFRKTSRVRRYVFDGIAKAMGLTREQLLND